MKHFKKMRGMTEKKLRRRRRRREKELQREKVGCLK